MYRLTPPRSIEATIAISDAFTHQFCIVYYCFIRIKNDS